MRIFPYLCGVIRRVKSTTRNGLMNPRSCARHGWSARDNDKENRKSRRLAKACGWTAAAPRKQHPAGGRTIGNDKPYALQATQERGSEPDTTNYVKGRELPRLHADGHAVPYILWKGADMKKLYTIRVRAKGEQEWGANQRNLTKNSMVEAIDHLLQYDEKFNEKWEYLITPQWHYGNNHHPLFGH